MSNNAQFIGPRIQIVLTLGATEQSPKHMEVSGTNIDAGSLQQLDLHTSMNLVRQAVELYISSILSQVGTVERPKILIPAGPMSSLKGD